MVPANKQPKFFHANGARRGCSIAFPIYGTFPRNFHAVLHSVKLDAIECDYAMRWKLNALCDGNC